MASPSRSQPLRPEELVLLELRGKHHAIGRYDAILWRVRSGYLIVLYGSLAFLLGQERSAAYALAIDAGLAVAGLLLITVLSLVMFVLDLGFRLRQLRVVAAADKLADIALAMATGKPVREEELRPLLHVSGESTLPIARQRLVSAVTLIACLYLVAPALAVGLYFVAS